MTPALPARPLCPAAGAVDFPARPAILARGWTSMVAGRAAAGEAGLS